MTDLKTAIPELRRPFTVAAVKFKPQSVTKTGKTICVAYIDARLASERLNHVVPEDWTDAYRPVGNNLMWCDLTVCGVTRSDVGEGTGKALVSDALKRAAVKFGVGVSLYAVPNLFLPEKVDAIYPDSREMQALRDKYEGWLKHHGTKTFGEPLDHGDVPDSAGEPEPQPVVKVPAGIVDEVIADAKAAVEGGLELAPLLDAVGAQRKNTFPQTVHAMSPEQIKAFRSNLADFKAAA